MAKAKMLTQEEITVVLAHVETSRYPERDRVMVQLSTRAGLRAAEIAALSWEHVLTADGTDVAEFIDLPRDVTKGQKRARVHARNRMKIIVGSVAMDRPLERLMSISRCRWMVS